MNTKKVLSVSRIIEGGIAANDASRSGARASVAEGSSSAMADRACLPTAGCAGKERSYRTLRWWALVWLLVLVTAGCAGRGKGDWASVARQEAFPLSELSQRVRRAPIVVLAETHALVEPIETLRMLLSGGLGWTHVVFEWPSSDQASLDEYMAGEDAVLERFRRTYGQLPGATTEYFETFSFIRESNRAHPERAMRVCAVDVPHPVRNVAEEERDRHMFDRIEALLEASPKSRVLVYCGDSHGAKCGKLEYGTRSGDKQWQPSLGARLCRRYPGKVVAIDVLSLYTPTWWEIKGQDLFQAPMAIPASNGWPEAAGFGLPGWSSDSYGRVPGKAVFDYVVWWPTSRAGSRSAEVSR